jgi:hypothetical protein
MKTEGALAKGRIHSDVNLTGPVRRSKRRKGR